jgi:DNA-binding NarL/FixJ family response regulator
MDSALQVEVERMPDHRSDGIDLNDLLRSVREVADGIVEKRWPALLAPGSIEKATEYLAARVRASVTRVADFTEFLKAVSDLVREMEQTQRKAAAVGRWYFDVLRRLDPAYAEALRQALDSDVVKAEPEPDDEEQPDSDGVGLENLPAREAVLLMLALHGNPMLKGEIIEGLHARGKEIDDTALSDALLKGQTDGEIVPVPPKPAAGVIPKWALAANS